jgi:predicted AAA+ superfamily ATPase
MTMKESEKKSKEEACYVHRLLDLPLLLEKKSHFLFGPRQTGKTFLIR